MKIRRATDFATSKTERGIAVVLRAINGRKDRPPRNTNNLNNVLIKYNNMKKDFIKELAELINKHGLEKEMRDTPDYILAQVCVDAMAVFSEAIARRDEWHGFRKADEKNAKDAKRNYPDDCNICKDRFKCADYMERSQFQI